MQRNKQHLPFGQLVVQSPSTAQGNRGLAENNTIPCANLTRSATPLTLPANTVVSATLRVNVTVPLANGGVLTVFFSGQPAFSANVTANITGPLPAVNLTSPIALAAGNYTLEFALVTATTTYYQCADLALVSAVATSATSGNDTNTAAGNQTTVDTTVIATTIQSGTNANSASAFILSLAVLAAAALFF